MEPKAVHLFVLDTMADWEPGLAVAGINQPTFQTNPGRYAVRTVGLTRSPVRTMGGLTLLPDLTLDELDPAESAMLLLPGGLAWDEGELPAPVEKARELLGGGVPVAAICGGTLGLARAGLLDGRPHTSNGREYLAAAPGYRGAEHYVDAPAVRDGDLITASGIAPVDYARLVFERLDLYTPPVLDAWYALYSTGDMAPLYALMAG